jgi:hypothetical protein
MKQGVAVVLYNSEYAKSQWARGVRIYSQGNNSFNVTVREPNLCGRQKHEVNTSGSTGFETLGSQRRFNLIDGGGSIGLVSVRYGGVLFARIIAEQQDLLFIEGEFRPSKIRQRIGGVGTARVVGIFMIDEVHWCNPHQRPGSRMAKEGKVHTESIHADMVTDETVVLRKFAGINVGPSHAYTLDVADSQSVFFHPEAMII